MMGRLGLEQSCVNAIRFLSADMIQKANSGHPGMPMGAAPIAYVLWSHHLKHNPVNPAWPDRDRFVLSAGHASAMLYSLLYLTGYDLSLSDLKSFRQWGSKTPGHPERGLVPGVESTTGPLGQGVATAVGMAIAEAHLASIFNRPPYDIINHYTYALVSDGDLMEGVSAEACSLAGHLKLGKLIVLYDNNGMSLAGTTSLTFSEDVGKRFEAYGWHVEQVEDGNNLDEIDEALSSAKLEEERPSLIVVKTVIGYGAPDVQNSFSVHGKPLGEEELAAAKKNLGWPIKPKFYIPNGVLSHFRRAVIQGKRWEAEWQKRLSFYAKKYPELAAEFYRRVEGRLPNGWDKDLPIFSSQEKALATRVASGKVLQSLAKRIPELVGGSADLNPSTHTALEGDGDFQPPVTASVGVQGAAGGEWSYTGRNIHFGVREHAMGAIANGLACHGGVIPFVSTFLVFSNYMRPAIRLAALMGCQVIYVFTHDSIGVGEDGPTHQPIEHLASLRAIPNLTIIRPTDANETVEAWKVAVQNRKGPTALVLSRLDLPVLDRSRYASAAGLHRGGYVLWQSKAGRPDVILISSGSEVNITLKAAEKLATEKINARVVVLPSWELFEHQSKEYRHEVFPTSVQARVAVEAGTKLGWERYTGQNGNIIGLDTFGASAPGSVLYMKFGFTVDNIVGRVKQVLNQEE